MQPCWSCMGTAFSGLPFPALLKGNTLPATHSCFFSFSFCQHFKQLVEELQAKGVGTVSKALTESFKILREVRVGAGLGLECPCPALHSSPPVTAHPSGCCSGEQAGANLMDPKFVTNSVQGSPILREVLFCAWCPQPAVPAQGGSRASTAVALWIFLISPTIGHCPGTFTDGGNKIQLIAEGHNSGCK